MTAQCPARKLTPSEPEAGPAIERLERDGEPLWIVRSFALTREILRQGDGTRQAGFGADQQFVTHSMRPPILYLEGDQHREQRRAAARFFAPAVIETYRPMMEQVAADLIARLRADKATDLSELTMRMAVQVAARVIGLTNSSIAAMSRRLGSFFNSTPLAVRRGPRDLFRAVATGNTTARFYYLDVKPAIRARRRTRREDLISQLIDLGFDDVEILTECLTYAAAGMATTRELISIATWHLIDDADLLSRYRRGDVGERRALLEELLRVEPVVGFLRRRATRAITVTGSDGPVTIGAGQAIELRLRLANSDPAIVGDDGERICPGRTLPRSVPGVVLSFGDGHHRCPGGPLATMESEIFLSRLFARDIAADHPPRVRWNPVSQGYDLDRFPIRLLG
jgi:cytochrome P450